MSPKVNHIAPPGHPIWILMEEHAALLVFAHKLAETGEILIKRQAADTIKQALPDLEDNFAQIKASHTHYLREENVLFPILEKYGLSAPTKVMWMEHSQIRAIEKKLEPALAVLKAESSVNNAIIFHRLASELAGMLSIHFHKENNILFPASMQHFSQNDFAEVKRQFTDIGFCPFTPGQEIAAPDAGENPESDYSKGYINFTTGAVTAAQAEAMLNTLPVEITFIDADDNVRYFSKPKEMIFTRTKAVLGRKVQLCHPEKSVHLVEKILKEFKSGKKDVAEFWLHLNSKYVHIRYFTIRSAQGEYLGCMEVAQDIAPLQKISGEKRLLDWE